MYGRPPVLPVELEKKARPDAEEYSNFDEKVAVMKKIREQAMENIRKAQERQKKAYNARHNLTTFNEGDEVLLRNMRNEGRKGGTLERVWTGTYKISKCLKDFISSLTVMGCN